jgi:hypothetical protein
LLAVFFPAVCLPVAFLPSPLPLPDAFRAVFLPATFFAAALFFTAFFFATFFVADFFFAAFFLLVAGDFALPVSEVVFLPDASGGFAVSSPCLTAAVGVLPITASAYCLRYPVGAIIHVFARVFNRT